MKKLNHVMTVLICTSLGLWGIKAVLDYHNYARHVELFAANGWFWYDDVLRWGKYMIPIVVTCFLVKLVIYRKRKA